MAELKRCIPWPALATLDGMATPFCPAYAEAADGSASALTLVSVCVVIVVVVGGLSLVPLGLAWSRRHRKTELITAFVVLWGLCTSLSVGSSTIEQLKWSKEQMVRIQSGYYDPADVSDAPTWPWPVWAVLVSLYAVLVLWPLSTGHTPREIS